MKKIKTWALVLIGIMMGSCTSSDDASDVQSQMGSIYGIVAELGTSEPMKSIGVELYKSEKLLLKTVTFDDGHFEFVDLVQGDYQVNVVSDEYEQTEKGLVTVEAGRQARIDLQVKKQETHMVVRTIDAVVDGSSVTLNGAITYESGFSPSEVGFVYAIQDNSWEVGALIKCKVASSFNTTLSGMSANQYKVKAYAKNSVGIAYGEVRTFAVKLPDYVIVENLMIQTKDLGRLNWYDATDICKASRLAGYSDWRLPTINELKIMYYTKNEIPNIASECYWSSSIYRDWIEYLDFSSGYNGASTRDLKYYVRAVRTIK